LTANYPKKTTFKNSSSGSDSVPEPGPVPYPVSILVLELDPKSDLGPVQVILTGTRTSSSNQPNQLNTGLDQ